MKYIIMLLPIILFAQTLEVLYQNVPKTTLYKSKSLAIESTYEGAKVSLYNDTWSVGVMSGYADGARGNGSGGEFALSLGRDFNLNPSKIDTLLTQNKEYKELQKKLIQSRIKVQLWKYYGNYCASMETLQAKSDLLNTYYTIMQHIEKGFEYGEFDSGKVLMSKLSLENLNMQIFKLENAVQNYTANIQSIVSFDTQFECSYQKINTQLLFEQDSSLLLPMMQKQLLQARSKLKLTQVAVKKINVQATYSHEIGITRYMLNLSMPLNYGHKNEAIRKNALNNTYAKSSEIKNFTRSYTYESSALKNRLRTYEQYLSLTEAQLNKSANLLIQRSKLRFKAGEESLIAMLKAAETKLQIIEAEFNLKLDRHNAIAQYMYKYAIDPQGVSK